MNHTDAWTKLKQLFTYQFQIKNCKKITGKDVDNADDDGDDGKNDDCDG